MRKTKTGWRFRNGVRVVPAPGYLSRLAIQHAMRRLAPFMVFALTPPELDWANLDFTPEEPFPIYGQSPAMACLPAVRLLNKLAPPPRQASERDGG